jgi:5-methylcytosine-specific restriction protein A
MAMASTVYMPIKPPIFRPFRSQPKRQEDRPCPSERGYGYKWQRLRKHILERDHYLCQVCGRPTGRSGNVDHIVAKSKGGTDDPDNLQTLCHGCHSSKTAREDGGYGRR